MAESLPLKPAIAGTNAAVGSGRSPLSPESALASEIFDQLIAAGTFKATLHLYREMCRLLRLRPTNLGSFYPRLKAKLRSWKASSLWAKLDKRAGQKCYNRGRASPNSRVLIIGAGPCGLRAAIECQLLGAKVVVLEKRDRFSRNNVLHLWPFVIHDLRNLGAKKFFGKFCAGSIDHISIRQLQVILLKFALVLGVEIHENVTFEELLEPPLDQTHEKIGWRAKVTPADHPVAQYEFDILIGADGKRNTLLGFNRKEFRGKLAIAVTANFINRHTLEEANVPEISGVAFIFNQKFFQDMKEQTGVDLENIVYYKDDTHYFVMTAKKQSLLDLGVIRNDYSDTARLLSTENVDREMLKRYAREAADFSTSHRMPHYDFAINHYGQADVAMFDFTSMYAAENACRMMERRGHRLLLSLVGDCLLEPFWPTGSGCARGFLSAFDAAWMVRSWSSGKMTPLKVLAEREACYRLLAQTTPENLQKDLNLYTLNPASRYPNLNLLSVLPSQVRCLCDTDTELQDHLPDVVPEMLRKKRRRISLIHPDALLAWCQRQMPPTESIQIDNLSSCWKSGRALCAILHRYRPDLVDLSALDHEDAAKNNQLAFDIFEREYGIPPIMTGQEMADCDVPDKLAMVAYLTQIYDTFRGEIPCIVGNVPLEEEEANEKEKGLHEQNQEASLLTRLNHKLHPKKNKYSAEKEEFWKSSDGAAVKRSKTPTLLSHKRRTIDRDKGILQSMDSKNVCQTGYNKIQRLQNHQHQQGGELQPQKNQKPAVGKEQLRMRMKKLQKQLQRDEGLRSEGSDEDEVVRYTPPRPPQLIGKICPDDWNVKMLEEKLKNRGQATEAKRQIKVGKLSKDEWNLQRLEQKIREQHMPPPEKEAPAERPQALQNIFKDKLNSMDARLKADGGMTEEEVAKFGEFDNKMRHLEEKLHKGNLDVGPKGKNRVAHMTQHMAQILTWDSGVKGDKKPPGPPAPTPKPAQDPVALPVQTDSGGSSRSEVCCFCQKRVYLMERLSAEGLFFHRSCFRCEYCGATLRLGHYAFDRTSTTGVRVFCQAHLNLQKSPLHIQKEQRFAEMMKRKHAFLSGSPLHEEKQQQPVSILSASPERLPSEIRNTETKVLVQPDVTLDTATTATKVPLAALAVPLAVDIRDRTPERVEFENTLLDLSEDELVTSELEEEELTQKNLGSQHELSTSDEDYSDFSTDTESDDEFLIEELEKSFTADGTRKLAETWKQKHESVGSPPSHTASLHSRHSLLEKELQQLEDDKDDPDWGEQSSEFSISEAEDEETEDSEEESETETGCGDDTSDDIETDEEYASDYQKDTCIPTLEVVKCDVVMEVPILCPEVAPEDSDEVTMSENDDYSDLEGSFEDGNEWSSEESITPCEDKPPPSVDQIPVIIVNESLPQGEEIKSSEEAHVVQDGGDLGEDSKVKEVPVSHEISHETVKEKAATDLMSNNANGTEVCSHLLTSNTGPTLAASSPDSETLTLTPVEEKFKQQENNQGVRMAGENAGISDQNVSPLSKLNRPKWEDIGKALPPLVSSPPSSARVNMDKFKFITGTPSSQVPRSVTSKTMDTPKELTFKLNELHRKIEELQKQLPSSPTSPPVTSTRPNIWKSPVKLSSVGDQLSSVQIKPSSLDKTQPLADLSKHPDILSKNQDSKPLPLKNEVINAESPQKLPAEIKLDKSDQKVCNSDKILDEPSKIGVEKQPDLKQHQSQDIKNVSKDIQPANPSDLSNELLELSKKYTFNPAYITLRKHNKFPISQFMNANKDEERSSLDNLVDVGKYKRLVPKAVGLLTKGLTSSQPNLSPRLKDNQSASDQASATGDNVRMSDFQGYKGSFADKVRPKSTIGDTIYLKSLSINLQKLAFPSMTKGSSIGGSCDTFQQKPKISPEKTKSVEDILLSSPEEKRESIVINKQPEAATVQTCPVPFADEESQSIAGDSETPPDQTDLGASKKELEGRGKVENRLAPQASVDSLTDTEEESVRTPNQMIHSFQPSHVPDASAAKKEQKLMRVAQMVQHKQELKRFRTSQEIARRLHEIDVLRKDLEQKGVTCEKSLRGESGVGSSSSSSKEEMDLMQEWFALLRNRNKLEREEQELVIRMKDLELEERHSVLQQEMRGRMSKSDERKTKSEVEQERDILREMLAIVEKRDELVLMLDQLKLREEVEDRDLEHHMLASGLKPEILQKR